jgi:hypothetical protein
MNASDIGSKLVQYWGKKPLKKFKTFPYKSHHHIPSHTFHDDDDANATPQKRDHDDGGARPFPLFHFYALFSVLRAELLHRRCANARATTRRGKETRFASASASSVVWKRKRAGRKTTAQTTATGRRRCSTGGATAAASSAAAATGAAARRTETTSPEHERSGFSNPKQWKRRAETAAGTPTTTAKEENDRFGVRGSEERDETTAGCW